MKIIKNKTVNIKVKFALNQKLPDRYLYGKKYQIPIRIFLGNQERNQGNSKNQIIERI